MEKTRYADWIWEENAWFNGVWRCSECGAANRNIIEDSSVDPYAWVGSMYCTNCGLPMRKQEESSDEGSAAKN